MDEIENVSDSHVTHSTGAAREWLKFKHVLQF